MLHRLLTPSVASHNAVVSTCEKGGHWEDALRLWEAKHPRSPTPSVISHSATISAPEEYALGGSRLLTTVQPVVYARRVSDGRKPFALLREMLHGSLTSNVVSHDVCEKGKH